MLNIGQPESENSQGFLSFRLPFFICGVKMAQGSVGIRFSVDVSQAKTQVEDLSKTVAGLKEQIVKATKEEDWKTVAQLTQALDNTTSARGQIIQQATQTQNAQARENMNNGGIFGGQTAWMFQTALNQITSGIIKSMDAALSAARQRASGDYAGAVVTQTRAEGEIAGQAGGAVAGGAVGAGLAVATGGALTFLVPMLANLGGELGRFLGGIDAKKLEEALAYSQQYKNALPDIDALNQLYGGAINRKTGEKNNEYGLAMHGRAMEATEGTGLTTNQLIEAVKQMGGYGIRSETQALNMVQNQALWSRFTGTDLSTIQKYAGQSYRFGGETGAVSTAYGGLMAQNMGKGQFSEFLNSMSRILEEGIAKGFVRSSSEIAGNMQMLYKLSGNSALWQGEQGAQRLSQMNMAISNATNLQSVEDVISFGVARDMLTDEATSRRLLEGEDGKRGGVYTGTYADVMQLLEQGVSGDMLEGQFESVSRLEGNNVAGIIERFKKMYGLNYTGAAQVYGMMDNMGKPGFSADEIAKTIEDMKTDPKYQSDSEKLQTAINKMSDNLVNIGQFRFNDTEWGMLESQAADVAAILTELRGGGPPVVAPPNREADRPGAARDYFTTETDPGGDSVFAGFQDAYARLIDPYRENPLLLSNLLGNGNISSFSAFLEEARSGGIDDYERDRLETYLMDAIEDFKQIIRDFNRTNRTEFRFPDNITVTEL